MTNQRKEIVTTWVCGVWSGMELVLFMTTHDWTHLLLPAMFGAMVLWLPLTKE